MRRGFGRKHAEVEAVVDDDDEAAQKREADKRARRGTKELLLTFNIIDRNGNGQLSRAELLDAVQHDPSVAKLLGLPKGSDKTRCAAKKCWPATPLTRMPACVGCQSCGQARTKLGVCVACQYGRRPVSGLMWQPYV